MKLVLIPALVIAAWVLLAAAMVTSYTRHAPNPKALPTMFAPTQVVVAPPDASLPPPAPTVVAPAAPAVITPET